MITIKPLKRDYSNGFIVEGHANYAEHGKDIICATVSAITQLVAHYVVKDEIGTSSKNEGELVVNIYHNRTEESIKLVKAMLDMLRDAEKQHPDYITVK